MRPPTRSWRCAAARLPGALPLLLVLTVLGSGACDGGGDRPPDAVEPPGPEAASQPSPADALPHTGDLPQIRRTGELRVLVQRGDPDSLPRQDSPLDNSQELAGELASSLGLEMRIVPVERFDDLLAALLDGRGDLVVENITVTRERLERVGFAAPIAFTREQVVTRSEDQGIAKAAHLSGRSVAVRRSSSFWDAAKELEREVPDLTLQVIPEELDMEGILEGVASGRFDTAIADSNYMDRALTWHPELRVALTLGDDRMIAWATRPDARLLRKATDGFLSRLDALSRDHATHDEDLPRIRERGVLRVLTRNSGTTYFIWRGKLMGFEYELLKKFADQNDLRLEMVVPPSRDDLFSWLLEGRGDLVAAGLTTDATRAGQEGVVFTRPYHRVRETIVARADDLSLESLDDLAGRRIAARKSSSYWRSLGKLRAGGLDFELVPAPEVLETEAIIAEVAAGNFDLTLADSHIVGLELNWRDDIRAAFELEGEVEHGWAVRPSNPELLAALDAFIQKEYRGLFYNMTVNKYFKNPRKMRKHVDFRASKKGQISPYDNLARRYSSQQGFDWRLVVSQMFQESRFDPKARSFAGARGLLQVMPRTGRELGYSNLTDPETGLQAGIEYLAWVRNRFEPELPYEERLYFTLAAYNVGYGHVRDARAIAADRGLDPNVWFGNVEQAILLKQKPEVHKNTRFGYCRGSEPVAYVRAIR
ncbi:MAG: transporter substrate-binding domain-containing protein, partial [Deltaproteobacteria bacterium]|nr:transporter substrate-binding domain-containing protein [Deltaproteobacteria bacterium]